MITTIINHQVIKVLKLSKEIIVSATHTMCYYKTVLARVM